MMRSCLQILHLHLTLSAIGILFDEKLLAFGSGVRTLDGWINAVLVEQVDVGFETAAFVVRVALDRDADKRSHVDWCWLSFQWAERWNMGLRSVDESEVK